MTRPKEIAVPYISPDKMRQLMRQLRADIAFVCDMGNYPPDERAYAEKWAMADAINAARCYAAIRNSYMASPAYARGINQRILESIAREKRT